MSAPAAQAAFAGVEAPGRRTRVRFVMLALITVATTINFLDRTVMGVVAPSLSRELKIAPATMGLIFSAFSWTYAAAQLPGGVFLDRFGSRLTYFLSLTFWSAITLLQGFVGGVGALLALRFGLGVAEAPCFPANSRVVATWFPRQERARATGVYSLGEYVGLAFLSPVLFWVTATLGWRTLFFAVGAVGIAFGLIWWAAYRDPHLSRRIGRTEFDHIAAGDGLVAERARGPFDWRTFGWLATRRQILGASLGQFGCNTVLVFFLTWFPSYLAQERHMDWKKSGLLAAAPFLAASVGVMLGGVASDVILRRTGSLNLSRKAPMIVGLLMIACVSLANVAPTDGWVIAVMSLAFFGQGLAGLGWTVITDVAPKGGVGMAAGIFNFLLNFAGILTPLVIGVIVARTGSYVGGLVFITVSALAGAASYAFLIGDIHRLEPPPPAAA